MALIFGDGFDLYEDLAELLTSGWNTFSQPFSFSTTAGRYGGGCITGTDLEQAVSLGQTFAHGQTRFYCFAHYMEVPTSGSAADFPLFTGFQANGTDAWLITVNDSGDLKVFDINNAQIGSTLAGQVTFNAWHFFEVRVKMSSTPTANDGELDIRQNGSLIYSQTGMDLTSITAGSDAVTQITFRGGSPGRAQVWKLDDVVIFDDAGDTPNAFIGDCRFETLTVASDGGVTDWTGASTDVDDPPNASDDDGGYIASSTAAQEARYNVSNLSVTPDDIWMVQVRARARKTDGGVRTYRGLINSNGTEAVGPTKGLGTEYFWDRLGSFPEDPDTGLAWEDTGINAMQVGVELVA